MKKCNNKKKSTPLSNHLVNVNVNTTTKFISFKKDMASSSSTTLPQKHVTQESNANVNGTVVAATTTKNGSLFDRLGRGKENEPIQFSSSPRHRLLEMKNNFTKPISNSPKCSSPLSSSITKSPPLVKQETQAQVLKPMKVRKCNKIANEKYDLRLKKMNQQDEHFMKKCNNKKKSTPLSNHLVNVNVNTTTKFISFKKDMASSSSTTLPQKH
nr:hypothetical protein [Tanacetum cinerariifolium]